MGVRGGTCSWRCCRRRAGVGAGPASRPCRAAGGPASQPAPAPPRRGSTPPRPGCTGQAPDTTQWRSSLLYRSSHLVKLSHPQHLEVSQSCADLSFVVTWPQAGASLAQFCTQWFPQTKLLLLWIRRHRTVTPILICASWRLENNL